MVVAALALTGCGGGSPAETPTSTKTSTVSAAPAPTFEVPEHGVDDLDAMLIAELKARGFDGDLDEATNAGAGLCVLANEVGLINASAETMDTYGYTPEQIEAVTAAALASYCPDAGKAGQ